MPHSQTAVRLYPGGRDTAAVMASPDYQAWATEGEPVPAAPPVPAQRPVDWAHDPADSPCPVPDPRSCTAALSVLSRDEIDVVSALLGAGALVRRKVAGFGDETYDEVSDLHNDLIDAWYVAIERENPGECKRQAREMAGIACKSCGAKGQHLTALRHKAIADTEWTTDWHCTDVRACHDRSVPGLAAILDPSGAPGPELDDEDRGAFTTYLACGDSLSDDEPHPEGATFTCPRHGETSFITLEEWKAQHPPYDPADPFAQAQS